MSPRCPQRSRQVTERLYAWLARPQAERVSDIQVIGIVLVAAEGLVLWAMLLSQLPVR